MVASTLIQSSVFNAFTADVATGLSTCILKDGTQTVTANIPFGGFKATGLGAGTLRTDAASLATIQDGTGVYIGTVGGSGDVVTLTPSPAITAYAAGQKFWWVASAANTTNVTINISGLGAKALTKNGTTALVANDILSGEEVEAGYDGTRFILTGIHPSGTYLPLSGGTLTGALTLSADPISGLQPAAARDLTGYLNGLGLSTAGGSATMTIAAGVGADSTGAALMRLTSSIGKTTSAWAVGSGNGGLDTGAIANSTWYRFFEIKRTDTGVVDVVFTIAAIATGPAMPANYTLFRYIGQGKTDGAAQWTAFVQDGDKFEWTTVPALDVNTTNPGASAVTATLTVPTGINVEAIFNYTIVDNASVGQVCYFSDLATTDSAPSVTATPLANAGAVPATGASTAGSQRIRTNTSAQIRYRFSVSDATLIIRMVATGWVDTRQRN